MRVRIIKGVCQWPKGHGCPITEVQYHIDKAEQHQRSMSAMIASINEPKHLKAKGPFHIPKS